MTSSGFWFGDGLVPDMDQIDLITD